MPGCSDSTSARADHAAAGLLFPMLSPMQGTSMPISIPLLQRRSSALDLRAEEARGHATTFVPPHMLHRQGSGEAAGLGVPQASLGLSPSAAAKREKLLARNAILRSTGFIEVQTAPVIGGCCTRRWACLWGESLCATSGLPL